MAARWLLRIVIWTAAGTALGFLILPCLDWFDRYPLIGIILVGPASLLWTAMFSLRFAPAGDAGLVIIPISIVLQWTLLGFVYGLYRASHAERSRAALAGQTSAGDVTDPMRGRPPECKRAAVSGGTAPSPGPRGAARGHWRVLYFMAGHKELSAWIAIILLTACYCLWQEILLRRDRDFLLRRVDYQTVAEACLGILSKPVQERIELVKAGPYYGPDPRLPEAIRRLDPECVAIHVDEVSIRRRYPNWLTFRQNSSDPTRYDLWYEEGPTCYQPTLVYSIHK